MTARTLAERLPKNVGSLDLLAAGLMLGGLGFVAAGLATPAKAALGQYLLERAWEASVAAAQNAESASDAEVSNVEVSKVEVSNVEGAAGAALARPWSWADMAPVARLSFPRLGEERLVLDKASREGLAWGPGHVSGTAPLGAPGLSAAAAHRDTHFGLLQDVEIGDVIELETVDGGVARYEVKHTAVVDVREWRFPAVFEGPDVLALATCFPFNQLTPGPERFVLFADRL